MVCTPEWLAVACRDAGGLYDARHHLITDFDQFDERDLRAWLAARVRPARQLNRQASLARAVGAA
jgi:hypothetical protein